MNSLTGSQIKVGEPVPFDCFDGNGQLLLKKGLIVHSQRQIDYLLERGLYGVDPSPATIHEKPHLQDRPPTPFELLDDFNNRLKQLFSTLHAERDLDPHSFGDRILRLAEDIQKLCALDTNGVLGAIHLNTSSRYTITHPLYRATVCELLGQRKSIPAQDRQRIVAAALTCDISMVKLQEELFRQNAPLLPEQRSAITAHPLETAKILHSMGVTDPGWLTAVIQHHERLGGEGYPKRLSGGGISEWARIIALADIYTAMITPRAYRKAALSKTAMRDLLLKRGKEVDDDLAVMIVKEFGVYPPGSFVKLHNGELAIVTQRSANPKAPQVMAVVGPRGAPFARPIKRDTVVLEYEVVDVVERDPIVVIDLNKLWGYDTD